jgi:type I restriction enzyme S subunit
VKAMNCNLPDGWKITPLAELCEINPPKPKKFNRNADALTTFIPMEAVDDKTGKVVASKLRQYRMVSHGYTYLEEGDIIFAKITPCMQNGKTAIAYGLVDRIAFGSTEFHVLRAKSGISPEWIYLLLRSAEFPKITLKVALVNGAYLIIFFAKFLCRLCKIVTNNIC